MSLFNTGVRPAIDNFLLEESKKERDYGQYWSASSAGYCMRRNIFERLKVPHVEKESDGRKQRVFTAGHLFHAWIQGITKEAGLSIASEVELQDEDLMVRGHFDDLVLIDGKLILYDYKSVNSRAFMWAKKNGNAMSYYHRYQVGTYMYMLRKDKLFPYKNSDFRATLEKLLPNLTEARILKVEKDTLMMSEQQLLWDEKLENEVQHYWSILNEYWANKKLPPCTCADHEGGFLAKEAYNPYFLDGEPCNIKLYEKFKEAQNEQS